MEPLELEKPWEELSTQINTDDPQQIVACLDSITPADTALAVSRLNAEDQNRRLTLLSPEEATEVIEDISDTQGAALIEDLQPEHAAPARQFLAYAPDTAGGLMVAEYLDFRSDQTIKDVLDL